MLISDSAPNRRPVERFVFPPYCSSTITLILIEKREPVLIAKTGPVEATGCVGVRGAHGWRSSARGSMRGVTVGQV